MDKEALKKEIKFEIENINRLVKEMDELLNKFTNKPTFIEIRAAGSILHDFYCGVEKILERLMINLKGSLPEGDDWHTKLLFETINPIKTGVRPIINRKLQEHLKEYLRFRHLFRHIYGFELKWEQFKNLSVSLKDVSADFNSQLNIFLNKL